MPTELKNQYHYSKIFSSYSDHSSLVEGAFKGDIAPLNFKNLRLTGFLERPSKLSELLLAGLMTIPNKDKKTLDNE